MMDFRKFLLSGSSLLAINAALAVAGLLNPNLAHATCNTVSGDTIINNASSNCLNWTSGNITVTGNGVLSATAIAIVKSGNLAGNFSNDGTITGGMNNNNYAIYNQDGTINSITNNGLIQGFWGIFNTGSIDLINNNSTGIINSTSREGIYNSGYVGTISNSGNITGAASGVQQGGTINTFSNSGIISGGSNGMDSYGSIGLITNSGTISGGSAGITNSGTIITISNLTGGTITGRDGIINSSSIGLISNDGLIGNDAFGNSFGISNSGSISILDNLANGTIEGSGNFGNGGAIKNSGTIDTINNGGTIVGRNTGITNSGVIGTINNSGIIQNTSNGIVNTSIIGTILNSGALNIQGTGIANNGASSSITTIVNTGFISGTHNGAINNSGNIGAINNSGTLDNGVQNSGTIGIITNSGTIISANGFTAIHNSGTIGTIINSGLITSGNSAIAIQSTGMILNPITNTGTIAGNINVNQDLTITGSGGTLSGGSINTSNNNLLFDSSAFQVLSDNINVGTSNTITNSGTIRLNGAQSITGNYLQNSSGLLIIGVTNPTTYGNFSISGNAVLTNDHISITPINGMLSSGETLTIIQSSTIGSNYTNVSVTAADGLTATVTPTIIGSSDELIISLNGTPTITGTYTPIGNALGGGAAPHVGAALDQILANNNTPDFTPIFTALNNLGSISSAAEGNALKQLAPTPLTPQIAASHFAADQTFQMIGQHQDYLFASADKPQSGQSAGEDYQVGSLWMQISGGKAVQDSTSTADGYQQSFYNMTFGADDHINKNLVLGAALSWQQSYARGGAGLNGDSVNVSTPELTGYSSYRYGPAYVNGLLGFGYNTYHESRDISFLNETATATYHGMQGMAKIETGWDYNYEDITFTRLMGFQAVHTENQGYTETGAGAANESVKSQFINTYTTSLGGKVATTVPTAWGDLIPALKLVWMHDLMKGPITTNASLAGVNFTTTTPRVSQDGAQFGLLTTLQQDDNLSLSLEYDGDLRQDYSSHSGQIKIKWDF